MPFTLRPEAPPDAAAIREVTRAAFASAPHASGAEARIVDALRAAGALTISLVAVEGTQVVGHVAISPVRVDGGPAGWFGLGPLSVAPERQRRGIGAARVRDALDRLRTMGAAGCVVLGDPAYYGRFGFGPAAPLVLPDVLPAFFQAIAFTGPIPPGTVRYHPAFDG